MSEEEGITAKKADNFSDWYVQAVRKGDLADYSAVKGCMVVKPNGYYVWERVQEFLNALIKPDGVRNAYFPLLIPESLLRKEADHFAGFTPEVAWTSGSDKGEKEGEGERLAIRPTSETIICSEVAGWVRSHRGLPVRLNQWCSVLRWETKTTRLFLRTREFLWQEGHTFWAGKPEAEAEVLRILGFYKMVAEDLLCVPVVLGQKSESEKFAGAEYTTCMEAMMPDGRALQFGTSHHLGQGFSRAFGVKFLDPDNKEKLAYYNTWGSSTRMIGGLVMLHGDDRGIALPPKVAETQAVVIPIYFKDSQKEAVVSAAMKVAARLSDAGIRVQLDGRTDKTPGWKFNNYEMLGVPLRVEIGPRDVEKDQTVLVRRDTGEKSFAPAASIGTDASALLDRIQSDMLARARERLSRMTFTVSTKKEFLDVVENQKGFAIAPWCGSPECEKETQEKTGASTRMIPFGKPASSAEIAAAAPSGTCVGCGLPAKTVAYFSRAY